MPHLFEKGFVYREPAWHGLADVKDERPKNWAEVREWGGFAWNPVAEPVFALTGIDEQGNPRYDSIEEFKRIVRSDTGATLSVNRSSYSIIDHDEMGEFIHYVLADEDQIRAATDGAFDPVLAMMDGNPKIKFDTAGVLDEGRMVWALVYLDEPIEIKGDPSPSYPYIAFKTRHDGGGALTANPTTVRIVCANTWKADEMESARHGHVVQISHSSNWKQRVEDARAVIMGTRADAATYAELATELLGIRVTPKVRETFVEQFFPMPPVGLISDRVKENVESARGKFRSLLDSPTNVEIQHTAWGLVQASGEYLDHVRGYQSKATLFGRQMLKQEPLKRKAVSLVREVLAEVG